MTKIFATISLNSLLVHAPCRSGLASFKVKFGHLDPEAPVPLLACLESNSVRDVIWALRAVHQDISAVIPLIAADFAESVLHLFEEKFPDDDRPRKAIEAARSGDRGKAKGAVDAARAAASQATDAADDADADDADAAAAAYAARAAAYAAVYADAAADATAYAAAQAAAVAAARATASTAAAADAAECNKQAETLRKYFTDKE